MMNRFTLPNDLIMFGKHKGKTIQYVIDNDKSYFNWMLKSDFIINQILIDYSNGIDIINKEIKSQFIKNDWTLVIKEVNYWQSKRIFGVRKSQKRNISTTVLNTYRCTVPFTTDIREWTEHIDCTKFHNDSVELHKKETIYNYDEKALNEFIESILLTYKPNI